jgi:predicted nuclease of predicted toxin-antitoxin system
LKIKVDEDLPKSVAESIRRVVPDTLTVMDEGLSGILDSELWKTTQKERRFLVTGDKAFANIRQYPPGSHSGVLLLRPDKEGILQMHGLVQDVLKLRNLEKPCGLHCSGYPWTSEGQEA